MIRANEARRIAIEKAKIKQEEFEIEANKYLAQAKISIANNIHKHMEDGHTETYFWCDERYVKRVRKALKKHFESLGYKFKYKILGNRYRICSFKISW